MPDTAPGRPRVLLVAEQLRRAVPGGIGTYVRGLLDGLASLEEPPSPEAAPGVALYASRARAVPDPLERYGRAVVRSRLPGPLLTRLWDRGIVRAPGGYEVVHGLSLAAPSPRDARLVMTVHDLAWRHRPRDHPRRGRRWHEAALRRALRSADHFVAPSESVARDLGDAGAPAGRVTIIPFGSDHLPAPDHAGADALLAGLGVSGPYLLSVGTIEPRKNLGRLVAAFGVARASLPERWPLVVVGPAGWGPRQLPADGVVLAGQVQAATLAALYARARLVTYVPLEEGFGLPPVEAMRVGTPVVSSPLPSIGDAALVVDPTDVEAIAAGIGHAAVDEELRARLVALGLQRTASLTWASCAAAHVAVWRRVS